MGSRLDTRRLALQALYQLDARAGQDAPDVLASLEGARGVSDEQRREAFDLAQAAYARREECDREMESLAPGWPAHRQPAVDRAILRLAHHEIVSGRAPPRAAISDAVELAKEFGTDRSPAFINALLDKVMARVVKPQVGAPAGGGA
jgi:N utilization substance protein B